MLLIDLSSNLDDVERDTSDFFRSQIPYAASLMLNATIKDVRRQIIGPTWNKAFEVRNRTLPGVMWRIKFSRKNDLHVSLYDNLGYEWMNWQTNEGIKRSRTGGRVAVPTDPDGMRTPTGRIKKSMKPTTIRNKKTGFIMKKRNTDLIVERVGDTIEVRYVLLKSTHIPASYRRLYPDAIKVMERVINGHFNTAMMRALRSSKYWR